MSRCAMCECSLCRKRAEGRSCGCRSAGIMLNAETLKIERCDACNLFDSDEDAAEAVRGLIRVLGETYEYGSETVADAFNLIERRSRHGR